MSLRPDFVTGNTRLKARLPDLAAGVGDGTAASSGDWRDLLRAVPTAYTVSVPVPPEIEISAESM